MAEERKTLLLEGLLPTDVWNTLIVLIILFGVFIAVFKGVVLIRDEMQKRKEKKTLSDKDVTDKIADKVTEKVNEQIDKRFADFEANINKRFTEIDTKLSSDKETLTSHTTQLNDHESRVSKLEGGSQSLCQGMLALLEADPSMEKAAHAMKNYLINGKYNEKDWE